jgi:hypothetical protein
MKNKKSKKAEIEMTKLVVILLMVITVIFMILFSRDVRSYIIELFNNFFSFIR